MPYQPYVYIVKNLTSGMYYIGSKYGRTTPTHPSTFWQSYFTSSKYVKNLIDEYGHEDFTHHIIYEGNNSLDVLRMEQQLIKKHIKNKFCLNKACGAVIYHIKCADARKELGSDGLTSYQKGARAGVKTKLNDVDDFSGLNVFQLAYQKALRSNPKLNDIRSERSHETCLAKIDPKTGMNVYQLRGLSIRGDSNPSKRPDIKQRISDGVKRYAETHTEEVKQRSRKINQALSRVDPSTGLSKRDQHSKWMKEHNPTRNSVWINNGVVNKRINSNESIPDGFSLGRMCDTVKHSKATCPHCGKTGGKGGMKRYHFDNCKHRDSTNE